MSGEWQHAIQRGRLMSVKKWCLVDRGRLMSAEWCCMVEGECCQLLWCRDCVTSLPGITI